MRYLVSRGAGAMALMLAGAAMPLAAQDTTGSAGSSAHGADVAVALRLSTLGVGLEVGKWLVPHLSVRVGANTGTYNKNGQEQTDVTYDIHLKLKAVEALVDLSPGARGNFHFTAGLVTNPMTIDADGQPTSNGTFTLGAEGNKHTYTAAQVGVLTAEGKFPGAMPYLGLGFGTPARKGGRIKFLFDLGVSIGHPTITLTATNPGNSTTLAADLNAQIADTQKDLDKLKVYPVLSFGLAYHF
jgi:hypothetical protein